MKNYGKRTKKITKINRMTTKELVSKLQELGVEHSSSKYFVHIEEELNRRAGNL